MNNRKNELKKLKKYELHSSWYLILLLTAIFATWLLVIYIVAIFQNKYAHDDSFRLINDIVVSVVTGLISGMLTILFAFIFLDLIKRAYIKDYFSYYSYLNSLRNKTKYTFLKDSKIPQELYKKTATQMTKTEFIFIVAKILDYSMMSPHYRNLVNEINTDFALHSFLTPNFNKQKSVAITKIIILDLLIPLAIESILLLLIIFVHQKQILDDVISVSAITRILIILLTTVFALMVSITIYEFYLLKGIKNYNSFNDFYFLSFNNFEFKHLNSSLIKR